MSFKRNTNLLSPSPSPRSSLEASSHVSIDLKLKDLKNFSRRLNVAVGAFRDEYKLLERLYYKGKNQHRLSLYWRRVSEIRRLCQRFDETRINYTVDTLRNSFFDLGNLQNNFKVTKGSWTHIPDMAFVRQVSRCLSTCSALISKMQERLLAAYRSFSLAIQSGAFLQLILALIAVVSRLSVVCQLLEENIQLILGIVTHVINLLHTIRSENSAHLPPNRPEHDTLAIETTAATLMEYDTPSSRANIPARTIVERDALSRARTEERKVREEKIRKRRKTVTDEIDGIFGF